MWCYFTFFTFCCLAAANCAFERDEIRYRVSTLGSQSSVFSKSSSEGIRETGLDRISTASSSPTRPSYEEQPLDAPKGSSLKNNGEDYKRPGNRDEFFSSHPEGGLFSGQSSKNVPDIEKGHLSGRPAEGPTDIISQKKKDNRPTGLKPDNTEEHSYNLPTKESSLITNLNETEKRPLGSRPTDNLTRPTGEFTEGQQPKFRPDHHEPYSEYSPTGPSSNQTSNKMSENDDNKDQEDEKDICFPNLGCFKMGKPWKSALRPIAAPHGPEKIQTTIHFYSRANLENQINITLHPHIDLGRAQFDPNKITALIVHGFSNSGNATWMKDMKNVYLKKVDANVLIVDWGKGAQLLNYLQVAGNTRVVGKQLGIFVKHLMDNYGAVPRKFHLIGHSLGAQICSYLAKEIPRMARLTALDPAQPGFEGFDAELRLDKTDAEFVDVIHTDARPFIPTLGFGMITPHGHVDFYMNGGFDQPGCVPVPKKELPSVRSFLDLAKYPVEVLAKMVACPHGRAYEYLIESFNETEKCIFWGHKADVKNVFKSVTNTVTQGLFKKFTALSPTCSKDNCIPLGFATKKSPLRGVFVVTTGNRPPYCISEPGIPAEVPPSSPDKESFTQKIGKMTGLLE